MSWLSRPQGWHGGPVNPLPGGLARADSVQPSSANCSIEVRTTGDIVGSGNTSSFSHRWFNGIPETSFWVRFTQISGDAPNNGGALNTWHQLNANRLIGYNQSTVGFRSGSFNIDIATDSGGANIVCSTGATKYDMYAEQNI